MKSNVRAFIAVEIAPSILTEAKKTLSAMKRAFPNVKWVDDENFHITLKFLGPNVPMTELHHIILAIQEACQNFEQFDLVLEGVGAFPNASNPRTIWIGVTEGVKELRRLAERIDDKLERFGFQREGREFSPHLTVGRTRQRDRDNGPFDVKSALNSGNIVKGKNSRRLQDDDNVEPGELGLLSRMIYERANAFIGTSPVDTVVLYSSELERGGPKYEPLAEIELSPLGTSIKEEYTFDAKNYDDPNFPIEKIEMEEHTREILDVKFDFDALDAEVEDELRAICGDKFAKKSAKKFPTRPNASKFNPKEQKKRLNSIKTEDAEIDDVTLDLNELEEFKDFKQGLKRKKKS